MSRDILPNGEARISSLRLWGGTQWDERVQRVRITAKLVQTVGGTYRFDRITGRDRSAFSPHCKPHRLVAYRFAGKEWVTVPEPVPQEGKAS